MSHDGIFDIIEQMLHGGDITSLADLDLDTFAQVLAKCGIDVSQFSEADMNKIFNMLNSVNIHPVEETTGDSPHVREITPTDTHGHPIGGRVSFGGTYKYCTPSSCGSWARDGEYVGC